MASDDDFVPENVDAYIASKAEFARPICSKLREIIRKSAPKLDEGIRWGGPSYKGRGLVFGIGAFKEHVSLFFARGRELKDPEGLLQHGEGNERSRSAKFFSLADLKVKPLAALVKQAAELDARGEPAKRKAKRPELPVPPALAAALRKNPRAKKTFDSIPPSARREYCEWIGNAKREETVLRRLEKAIDMLNDGRCMNDMFR
jgi:uncharacterized protein YdeI (YjbR/CyaY-like superfamily)